MNQQSSFIAPARINRQSFLIRGLFLLLGAVTASFILSSAEHACLPARIVVITSGAVAMLFLCYALFRSILIPRLRDIGVHPAWSLLILVHSLDFVFLLALLVIPTNAFARRSWQS